MNRKNKLIVGLVIFVLFLGGTGMAYQLLSKKVTPQNDITIAESKGEVPGASQAPNSAEERTKAPDFTVLDSEGNEVKLSELVGTPIVLNFWASWCPPCKSEMPEFHKVFEELGEEVTFMMVDMVDGQRETMEKGQKYVEESAFTFPVYYDTKQEAAYTYGVASIPTTLFIDKEGYLVTGAQGAIDEKTLRKGISFLLEEEVVQETPSSET